MRSSQLICDGLWRCLCPAVDGTALRRAVSLSNPNRVLAHPGRRPSVACERLTHTRRYGSDANLASNGNEAAVLDSTPALHTKANNVPRGERLLTPKPPTEQVLRHASVEDIVSALIAIRDARGWSFHGQEIDRHGRIVQLVKHLVVHREQVPGPFIYECMMDAMADPQGSVRGIRKLFDDLKSRNMKPTSAMCHSALAALANHPDYALRQEVLDVMQEFWFTRDQSARQSVVLGLLRDGQYELAYTRLTEMIEQKARVDIWVYDVFIMVFGKLGFLDEMLLLLYRRKNMESTDKAMASLLYHVLDVSSQGFHYPGTLFAWNTVVRNSLFQPPDGIVENVLATAARHGDATLATEALDKIAQRTRVLAHHYEAVVEAFARSGDVAGAFRTLCIMKQNGIRIVRANTRVVYEALRQHAKLVEDAESTLRDMAADQELPVAAVGVVVEALAETQGSEAAMTLYRDVPVLCGEQANAAMIQTLLINSRDAEVSRSLCRDYAAHIAEDDDPLRSPHVYDGLIKACAEAGELDLAFRFANQALTLAERTPAGTGAEWVRALVTKAVEVEDGRIWGVVDELGKGEMAGTVQKMLRQMRITKRAAGLRGK